MPKTSKFFKVATEGATTDGRAIKREWIQEMAEQYSPQIYGARINLEHIRGPFPDGTFKSYGDVVALKAEEENGKLCLFAQINPIEELVEMVNIKRQKIYTSVEIRERFADTDKAYLMGIAVTDSPASLGTEMLKFCAQASSNPLAARKDKPDDLFSEAVAADIQFEPDDADASLFSRIKSLLGRKEKSSEERFADVDQAVTQLAQAQRDAQQAFSSTRNSLDALIERVTVLEAGTEQLSQQQAEHTEALSRIPAGTPRPPATGSQTDIRTATDC